MALGQVEMGDEAHVGLVDAHAEGDRGDHDHALLLEEAVLVARRAARCPGRRGRAAPAKPCAAQGRRRSRRPCARQAVDDAGSSACCGVRKRSSCARRAALRARPCSGCWAGRSRRRTLGRSPSRSRSTISAPGRRVGGGGQRQARHAREALVQHRELAGSRGGSRGPIARRSAPRRWRTGASVAAAPAARGSPAPSAARARRRAGRARRSRIARSTRRRRANVQRRVERRRRARRAARSASTWSCISAISGETTTRQPVAAAGPGSGSTATCRRRSASAPARRRRRARAG